MHDFEQLLIERKAQKMPKRQFANHPDKRENDTTAPVNVPNSLVADMIPNSTDHRTNGSFFARTCATAHWILGILVKVCAIARSVFIIFATLISMLERSVRDAAERREIRSVLERHDFEERLVDKKARELAERQLADRPNVNDSIVN